MHKIKKGNIAQNIEIIKNIAENVDVVKGLKCGEMKAT